MHIRSNFILLPFFKDEKYRAYHKSEADKIIPFEFFLQVKNRKDGENDKGYNFLYRFKLGGGVFGASDAVSRHLKAIFDKRDEPAYDYSRP